MRLSLATTVVALVTLLQPMAAVKVQTTRTALHVARSLNPESMEEMAVKTRNGDVATIIVKKRGNSWKNDTTEPSPHGNSTGGQNETEELSNEIPTSPSIPHVIYSKKESSRMGKESVPEPVLVSSSSILVKNDQNNQKKARSMVKVDHDGIPVVTGVRVPDDDTDKQVWRNARVINGVLVPYEKTFEASSSPTRSKPRPKPPSQQNVEEEEDGWLKIGAITKKPVKTNVHQTTSVWPDQRWAAAALVKTTSKPQALDGIPSLPLSPYKQHPAGLWIPDDSHTDPEQKYVTDKILDYIRNINKEEMKRLSMHKFTARDARMVSDEELDLTRQQPRMQARILHDPGESAFPDSSMYSPSTLAPSRVSFEEGVRTPVLQYAHPEYGVQAVKLPPSPSESRKHGVDLYADRSPFAYEPAVAAAAAVVNPSELGKRSVVYHQRPKKTLGYFYSEKRPSSANYYGKYGYKDNIVSPDYPSSGLYYEESDGRPFWLKFGDSLKEQVRTSIDKVTDFTRPVMEPLVEATHKITKNLGISSGNRELSVIRERLGIASPTSLILPAIGIVAGSAALGLGAVAVGRFLNYDVVKMRNAKSLDQANSEDATQLAQLGDWVEDNSRSVHAAVVSAKQMTSFDTYLKELLRDMRLQQQSQDLLSGTPCSKRALCRAMTSELDVPAVKKKIDAFLKKLDDKLSKSVRPYLDDALNSAENGNCEVYSCEPESKTAVKE